MFFDDAHVGRAKTPAVMRKIKAAMQSDDVVYPLKTVILLALSAVIVYLAAEMDATLAKPAEAKGQPQTTAAAPSVVTVDFFPDRFANQNSEPASQIDQFWDADGIKKTQPIVSGSAD